MLAPIKHLSTRVLALIQKVAWLGPLLVRLTVGAVFAATGWGKLHNLGDVTNFFESLHIPAPAAQAAMVSTIEFVGGLLLIVGLGTRIVSVLLIGVMTVAIYTAKLPDLHGVIDLAGTNEFAYLAMFVWLAVSGAGLISADHLIARRGSSEPRVGVAP
jgi:putative oxidoreductase